MFSESRTVQPIVPPLIKDSKMGRDKCVHHVCCNMTNILCYTTEEQRRRTRQGTRDKGKKTKYDEKEAWVSKGAKNES